MGVMVVTLVDALLHVLYLGVISRLAKQALLLQHLCRGGGEERKREKRGVRGPGPSGRGARGRERRECSAFIIEILNAFNQHEGNAVGRALGGIREGTTKDLRFQIRKKDDNVHNQ